MRHSMVKATVHKIDLHTENGITFVTLHYDDGSTLDLIGKK